MAEKHTYFSHKDTRDTEVHNVGFSLSLLCLGGLMHKAQSVDFIKVGKLQRSSPVYV